MDESVEEKVVRRRLSKRRGFFSVGMRTVIAFTRFLLIKMREDVMLLFANTRLFLGLTFFAVGTLSFASDRYCDGNSSSYYACTRPSTYYYYPWWAVLLVVVGSFFVVLWFLRRK